MNTDTMELNMNQMEQAAGGKLSEDMERKLLATISEWKRKGGTLERMVSIFGVTEDITAFIKENFWWVAGN